MTAARRIAVVTGSRAEFGLLSPVMRAIDDHPDLDLRVLVAGAHLLPPELTVREVTATFDVAARIPMQEPGATSRGRDALALGRGVSGFASWLGEHPVEVVVVLGDRIEAFAAAAAASVAGVRVALASTPGAPMFSHSLEGGAEIWRMSERGFRGRGARWLPVRQPELYAGEVFQALAGTYGITLDPARPAARVQYARGDGLLPGGTAAKRVLQHDDLRSTKRVVRLVTKWDHPGQPIDGG